MHAKRLRDIQLEKTSKPFGRKQGQLCCRLSHQVLRIFNPLQSNFIFSIQDEFTACIAQMPEHRSSDWLSAMLATNSPIAIWPHMAGHEIFCGSLQDGIHVIGSSPVLLSLILLSKRISRPKVGNIPRACEVKRRSVGPNEFLEAHSEDLSDGVHN